MNILRRWLLLLLVLAPGMSMSQPAGAAASAAAGPVPATLAAQEFRDQFGNTDSLVRRAGAPVVAVVVSVRGLAMIEKWERDLTARVPGIRFLNVADFPAGAAVDLDRAARTLRQRVPPNVPVLMDPARQWATALGLDTAVPNLLVFDAAGQLKSRFRGRWSPALAADVAAALPAPGTTEPTP